MIALIVTGGLCLWVGIVIGFVIHARPWETVGRVRDTDAIMASFNEWTTTGEVSPATRQWLETGIKPRAPEFP